MITLPRYCVTREEPGAFFCQKASLSSASLNCIPISLRSLGMSGSAPNLAPPGRYCAILSTGTGTATPPSWTPGDGEGWAFGGAGVGVRNAAFGAGVTHGVGLELWAKAVGQTIDAALFLRTTSATIALSPLAVDSYLR